MYQIRQIGHLEQKCFKGYSVNCNPIYVGCDKTRDEPSQVTDRGHGEWS